MGYEVRPDGTIIAPDENAAIRLSKRLRELAESTPNGHKPRAPLKAARAARKPDEDARAEAKGRALAMLRVLAVAGAEGVDSKPLAKQTGVASPKGLSPYALLAKAIIDEKAPGEADRIFWRTKLRNPRKTTWYVDGPRLRELGLI
jgi:hypothetical protein